MLEHLKKVDVIYFINYALLDHQLKVHTSMKFSTKVPIPFSNSFMGKKFIEPLTLCKASFQEFRIYPLGVGFGGGNTDQKKSPEFIVYAFGN